MPPNTSIIVTAEQKVALQKQLRLMIYSFVLDITVNFSVLAFNSYYIPTHECVIMAHKAWLLLWPMNNMYIATLRQANFSERDICVMVSTLSLASVVCVVTTVLPVVCVFVRRPTVYFKNVTATCFFALAVTTWYILNGIGSGRNLFGPTEDKSAILNSVYILVTMCGWFYILMLVVDRVRSLIAHAIANR